jgi:hypothetical protein
VDDNTADLIAPPLIGWESNPYIHDSPGNMQQGNHKTTELDDYSAVNMEWINEKVRRVKEKRGDGEHAIQRILNHMNSVI